MHIAVTGSRGFIGRRVVEALLRLGAKVTSIERLEHQSRPPVWPHHPTVNRRWIDFATSPDSIRDDCGSPDALIHLAWGGLPNYGSSHHLEHELPLHASFLSGVLRSGTPHVVVAGTCFEYGLAEGLLKETTPTRPTIPYAEAKVRLHEAIEPVVAATGQSLTWLRPFYVFGSGQPATTLWGQLHAAMDRGDAEFPMSGGNQTRDYLHVEEMARLISEVSIRAPGRHSELNICSGKPTQIRRLVESWIAESGSSIRPALGALPYSAAEPLHAYGSTARLHKFLGHD